VTYEAACTLFRRIAHFDNTQTTYFGVQPYHVGSRVVRSCPAAELVEDGHNRRHKVRIKLQAQLTSFVEA
jgi:hypothetical protein